MHAFVLIYKYGKINTIIKFTEKTVMRSHNEILGTWIGNIIDHLYKCRGLSGKLWAQLDWKWLFDGIRITHVLYLISKDPRKCVVWTKSMGYLQLFKCYGQNRIEPQLTRYSLIRFLLYINIHLHIILSCLCV